MTQILQVALAQIAPVWLNKAKTKAKIIECIKESAANGAELIVFGEGLLPGYPFWVDQTDGARFNSEKQKEFYAHYVRESVCIEKGELTQITEACRKSKIACYLGIIECPENRGGHSLYCSLVYINQEGGICSVHRKLMPTYEERLVWSTGDGHGLVTHKLKDFTLGGLNCWENWMPLARTSLYAQGENLHISVWPGNQKNTEDLLPILAKEGRSFVIGVSGLFAPTQITDDLPNSELLRNSIKNTLANGGSCIAAPDGSWIIPPFINEEKIAYAALDYDFVLRERQNFDSVGHYSRPDVLSLNINKERQQTIKGE